MIWAAFLLPLDLSAQRCGCMHNVKLSPTSMAALAMHGVKLSVLLRK